MATSGTATTRNPEDVCWTPALAARALGEQHPLRRAWRERITAALCEDADRLMCFVVRWGVAARFFQRCERQPKLFARYPEMVDAAVIELRAALACCPTDVQDRDIAHSFRSLARTLRTIEAIAERTRARRQQSAALHDQIHDALHRTPVGNA